MQAELLLYGSSIDVAVCLSTAYQEYQNEESDKVWMTYRDSTISLKKVY